MKGPMKGATISHAKQRIVGGRYLGLTEPGIIAAEAPNPIVNELVILPDIEKRLEAFVRVGHGVIIFPGGAGTAEEFLYLLGILMHPDNQDLPFPVILTGPRSAEAYLQQLHEFVGATLGHAAQRHYRIVIDDPAEVAKQMAQGLKEVKQFRRERNDAFHFNWMLKIDESFQRPFEPTHENMASLQLSRSLPPHELAANLRRAFSGIVAGNVKDNGIRIIEQYGPYEIHGDPAVMLPLDRLLQAFVKQHRMKLPGGAAYVPATGWCEPRRPERARSGIPAPRAGMPIYSEPGVRLPATLFRSCLESLALTSCPHLHRQPSPHSATPPVTCTQNWTAVRRWATTISTTAPTSTMPDVSLAGWSLWSARCATTAAAGRRRCGPTRGWSRAPGWKATCWPAA